MTIKEALESSAAAIARSGSDTPRLDAELILSHVLKTSRTDLLVRGSDELPSPQDKYFFSLIERRTQKEPVAYITGKKGFWKFEFEVGPSVLIPRPETELIVEKAVEIVKKVGRKPSTILDFGTGSGCLAICLQYEIPAAHIVGVDVSVEAILVARKNEARILESGRIQWIQLDLNSEKARAALDSFAPAQMIVANPPYISADDVVDESVKKFEPSGALFSRDNGLFHIHQWMNLSYDLLDANGCLLMEIGAQQGPDVLLLATEVGYVNSRILKDLSGRDRIFWGSKSPSVTKS